VQQHHCTEPGVDPPVQESYIDVTNNNMNLKDHQIGCKKVLENQAITFAGSVYCNSHAITTLVLSAQDVCNAVSTMMMKMWKRDK
jgi:hypothetical protein